MTFLSDLELERYGRQILVPSFKKEGQIALKNAHILVIGAGGLGAPLLQQLACNGVGTLGIIDHDRISLSNLPRQIIYSESDIGALKVEIAQKHLHKLNSNTHIHIYPQKATKFLLSYILQDYDLICDCTDNAETRLLISDLCLFYRKILISGAVQGVSGQYATFYSQKHTPCYRCLFPEIETTPVFNCSTTGKTSFSGILSPASSIIANFMALEILHHYAHKTEKKYETKLTIWDGITQEISHFKVPYLKNCTAPHPQ